VTLYIDGLDAADAALQRELADFLGASGALGLESIRWIASATRSALVLPELRLLPWIRVALPPLRERPDREALIGGWVEDWNARSGRRKSLTPAALAALMRYAWPGNLRELEAALDATLAHAPSDAVEAGDLRLGAKLELPWQAETPAVREPESAPEPVVEATPEPEPEPIALLEPEPEPAPEPARISRSPGLAEVVPPLVREVRRPLLAIRTYASLLQQRPDDPAVRRELLALVDEDLGRVDADLARLERYLRFAEPRLAPVRLADIAAGELDARQDRTRAGALVVLRELDLDAPALMADADQLRFALGALLDRALRMIPRGGDLYVGSLYQPAEPDAPARHRLLIRFHSPEEVLLGTDGGPEPSPPLEVVLARDLIERAGGSFAVDATGAQDNVVLIELPVQ
jgi:signal transduction histidine kinase